MPPDENNLMFNINMGTWVTDTDKEQIDNQRSYNHNRRRTTSPLESLKENLNEDEANNEENNTSHKNSTNIAFETDEEDPMQFIDGFIKIYEHMSNDDNYKQQHISVAEYAEKVQSILLGIKAGLEKCAYYIKPTTIDGVELDLNGYKLKKTLIENMYIVQPLEKVRLNELAEISNVLQKQAAEGAFNNKALVVVPYDIRVLKATLKE